MNSAGFVSTERSKMCGEAIRFCIDWWNVSVMDCEDKSPEEIWSGKLPELKQFGEVGVIKNLRKQDKIKRNLYIWLHFKKDVFLFNPSGSDF